MGRYYSGDIEGNFWFGVQSSDDASFFGGSMNEPSTIEFDFQKDDLPQIEEGLRKCDEVLAEHGENMRKFFDEGDGFYNQEKLSAYLGFPPPKNGKYHEKNENPTGELLSWYARRELGRKILKCVQENGYCNFTAEL